MKIKTLIFAFFALTASVASAQNIMLRIGGGLASHYDKDSKNVGSFKLGVGYEFEMTGMWSIEPSVSFYAKGWKDKNQQVNILDAEGNLMTDEDGNPLTGIKNVTSTANYIEMPILFHYYHEVRPKNYVVFTAGPYIAYGIGGKMEVKGDAEQPGANKYYYSKKTFSEEGSHRLDAGIQAGIAYEFNRNITVGVEADFGLLNASHKQKNFSALINVRYRLPIAN